MLVFSRKSIEENDDAIIYTNLAHAIAEYDLENENIKVHTDRKSLRKDLIIMKKHAATVVCDNHSYHPSKIQGLDFQFLLFSLCLSKSEVDDTLGCLAPILSKKNAFMTRDEIEEKFKAHSPQFNIDSIPVYEYAIKKYYSHVNEIRRKIIDSISIRHEVIDKVHTVYEYDDAFANMVSSSNRKIFVLNDLPGSNKTVNGTKPIVRLAQQGGLYPVTVSGKRTTATAVTIDESVYYLNDIFEQAHERDSATALSGVVNTVYSAKFANIIEKSRFLVLEEVEDMMSHLQSSAAGNTLKERTKLLKALLSHCKKVNVIVVVDALCSGLIAETLKEITGFELIVCKQTKPKIVEKTFAIVKSEDQITESTRINIGLHGGTIVFSDCSNNHKSSHLNVLKNSLGPTKDVLAITADYFKDDKSFVKMNTIEEEMKKYPCVLFSPVFCAGTSFVNNYSMFSAISHKTITPKQFIQTTQRVRKATEVNMSFTGSRNIITEPEYILLSILQRESSESELNKEYINEIMEDPYVNLLVKYIAQENYSRVHYENAVLFIAEYLGYKIRVVEEIAEVKSAGKKLLKENKTIEDERRTTAIMNSHDISKSEAERYRKMMNVLTQEQKDQLARYEINSFYAHPLTPELIAFDNAGQGQIIIRNISFVLQGNSKANTKAYEDIYRRIVRHVIKLFHNENLHCTPHITKSMVDEVYEFLVNGYVQSNDRNVHVNEFLRGYIPHFKILASKHKVLVDDFLKATFCTELLDNKIKVTNPKTKKQERVYSFKETEFFLKAMEYYNHIKERKNSILDGF